MKIGKATESLLEMLEDGERRRKALMAGREAPKRGDVQPRLERVLSELPGRVQAYLEDLEALLARHQVERGKDILASLGMEVVISADGSAEIRGDLRADAECGTTSSFSIVMVTPGYDRVVRRRDSA